MRSKNEIDEQINLAYDGIDQGSKWPGMAYEDGVASALEWVTGGSDQVPMEED